MDTQHISALIDSSPMNRGMVGEEWLLDPRNIAIVIDDDAFIFEGTGEGRFEFHWLETKSETRKVITNTLAAFDQIFKTTNAQMIYGLVSVDRRDSALMARWIGAQYVGDVETEFGRCQFFTYTREIWEGAGRELS